MENPSIQDSNFAQDKLNAERLPKAYQDLKNELAKTIVGQEEVIEQLVIALFSGGHCLLTGAPGLAKTLLVRSVADAFSLKFSRIQFTPDLMPADITGTEILQETDSGRKLTFVQGPIFANIVLADEINRTPPKTQAALLEAMQEHQVTAAGIRHVLSEPFFVLATQNPIEMDGTYPLPEAQLDRFMFNIVVDYLDQKTEAEVVKRTTAEAGEKISEIFSGDDLIQFNQLVRKVPVASEVVNFAVKMVAASRPHEDSAPDFVKNYVNWGAGLRASQFLILGGKARALLQGRSHVNLEDVRAVAEPVLRHRVLLNYRAEADQQSVDSLVKKLIDHAS